MNIYENILNGGDLRSIGGSNKVVAVVGSREEFDGLFTLLFHSDRRIVMRAGDAIEKITITKAEYLQQHKAGILELCSIASDKELKWHLALIVSRLNLTKKELGIVWQTLTGWALDRKNSRVVRVNSLQGLYNLFEKNTPLERDLCLTIAAVIKENIPSITARVKKFRKLNNKI